MNNLAEYMPYVRWYLQRLATQLGLIGGLALLILLSATYLYATQIQMQSQKVDQLTHQHKKMLAEKITMPDVTPPLSPAQRLTRFYALFPVQADMAVWLDKLQAQANKHKISLAKGQYRQPETTNKAEEMQLQTVTMLFPVTGTYTNVRAFISGALKTMPNAALTQLQLTRPVVSSAQINANVQFTFYYQQAEESP